MSYVGIWSNQSNALKCRYLCRPRAEFYMCDEPTGASEKTDIFREGSVDVESKDKNSYLKNYLFKEVAVRMLIRSYALWAKIYTQRV